MEPDYWYEFMIQLAIAQWPAMAGTKVLHCSFWGNFKSFETWPTLIFFWLVLVGVHVTVTLFYYVLWTQYYSYYTPMPFGGYIGGIPAVLALYVALYWR